MSRVVGMRMADMDLAARKRNIQVHAVEVATVRRLPFRRHDDTARTNALIELAEARGMFLDVGT